jgi:hypothetical protein
MFNFKKIVAASAIALAVSVSALVGLSASGTAHADCSPLLKYCLNETTAKLKDENIQVVKNPVKLNLRFNPSAEIIEPSDNEVFFVSQSYESVQIDVEGKGNGANGFYTGFDSSTGTGLWWRATNLQAVHDYAQGAQDTITLHAPQYGCRTYVINLQVWENFTTMAQDWHGISVCVQ